MHDVRGSFGVIKNIADQLHVEEADEVLKTEFLTLLQKSVSSLHGLLNNLLVLSRLEAGQEQRDVQPIDAALILKELSESFPTLGGGTGAIPARSGTVVLAGARGRDQYPTYRAKSDLERASNIPETAV